VRATGPPDAAADIPNSYAANCKGECTNGDGAESEAVESRLSSGETAPIRVLHVDDDPAFGDLTAARLARTDGDGGPIRVESVTEPDATLDRLDDADCVVSDFEMPETDGLDLLDAVRDRRPDLPFVLFTGKGSEEIASRAISAGVTDYLRKGGSADRFDVLANRIRNAVACYRAEREAERRETHLRRVVDVLPECIFVKDAAGRYVLVNRAGAETYGMTPEAVEGSLDRDILPPEDAERFREEDREILASDEPTYRPEQRRRTEDGSLIVERVQKLPFGLAQSGEGVLGVVEDITDEHFRRRHREAALSAVDDAESALAEARTADGEAAADAHDRCTNALERVRTLLSNGGPLGDDSSANDSTGDDSPDGGE
jgi:PAS domain S-box-containing protein